jgi:organic hydroperoxide reductase OsmC/OhrA
MLKLQLRHVRVDQVTRFYRQGSVLDGTIKSGSLGVEVAIDVDSDELPERIAELVRVAKASCFTHGALAGPVAVETSVRLNGLLLRPEPAG